MSDPIKTAAVALLRALARSAGVEVVRRNDPTSPLSRRMMLLTAHRIDTVIDVGANNGQYARQLRRLGFRGRILSFEPLSAAFAVLRQAHARAPDRWEIEQVALGDHRGRAVLNISANSVSSSILPMLPAHTRNAPDSLFVGQEEVPIETLAAIIGSRISSSDRLFVKTDTQGYDAKVLSGAADQLQRIDGIQVEMSLVPLYAGEMLLWEMVGYLADRGFTLMSLEPGFVSRESGQLLQCDGVFFRENTSP